MVAPRFVDIRPGQRLHVFAASGSLSSSYESVIRHVGEFEVRIDLPTREGDRMEVLEGEDLTLILEIHGRMYHFESSVVAVEHTPEAFIVSTPREVEHNERRQFYRLMSSLTPRYAARIDSSGTEVERLDIKILDISGGGVQITSRQWIPVGARVRLIFSLDDDAVDVSMLVLALEVKDSDPRPGQHRVHAKFVGLGRAVQEQIIRYIFRQQVLLSQKRAG